MSKVLGKDVKLFIYDDGMWKLYACGRSCTLNTVTEYVETTVSGSGIWKTVLPTKNSWTVQADGVVHLMRDGMITLPELRAKQAGQIQMLLRFQRTDTDANVYTDEGYFFITNIQDTGAYNDVAVFSFEGVGTGAITQVFTVTPGVINPKDMRQEFTTVDGQTTYTNAALAGKYILDFDLDGRGFSRIITSGTPVNKEVKYTSATGTFEWAIPSEGVLEGYIICRDL